MRYLRNQWIWIAFWMLFCGAIPQGYTQECESQYWWDYQCLSTIVEDYNNDTRSLEQPQEPLVNERTDTTTDITTTTESSSEYTTEGSRQLPATEFLSCKDIHLLNKFNTTTGITEEISCATNEVCLTADMVNPQNIQGTQEGVDKTTLIYSLLPNAKCISVTNLSCQGSEALFGTVELFADPKITAGQYLLCPTGTSCILGKCITPGQNTCVDSDVGGIGKWGHPFFNGGKVTFNGTEYVDDCKSDTLLMERSCSGDYTSALVLAADNQLKTQYVDCTALGAKCTFTAGSPAYCVPFSGAPPPPDQDKDGVPDLIDNCPGLSNPEQTDVDKNGRGDACQAVSLASGYDQHCAVMKDTTVRCWGSGFAGDGYFGKRFIPTKISNLENVLQVDVGEGTVCGVIQGGQVYCWGDGMYGELGSGSVDSSAIPVQVKGIITAKQVAVGQYHACALLQDGSVQCWGWNGDQQIGQKDLKNSLTPISISDIKGVTQISTKGNHTCAVIASSGYKILEALNLSVIKCWGSNTYGKSGDWALEGDNGGKNFVNTTFPPHIVRTNQKIDYGVLYQQSGLDNTTEVMQQLFSLKFLTPLIGVKKITTTQANNCVLMPDTSIQCWGKPSIGVVLGLGDNVSMPGTSTAIPVTILAGIKQIVGNDHFTCSLAYNGGIACWGDTKTFEENGSYHDEPQLILNNLSNIQQLSASSSSLCALISDGSVKCWGTNFYDKAPALGPIGLLGTCEQPNYSYSPVDVQFIDKCP